MPMGWRVAVVVSSLLASGAGVAWWQLSALPHPSVATQEQIGYWLVLRNLADEPVELQVALVDRLNKEATTFSGTAKAHQSLTDSQSEQLYRNIAQLKFAWFKDRVAQYRNLQANRQRAFLREQIQVVHQWAELMIEHELVSATTQESDSSRLYELFFEDVESWVSKIDGAAEFSAFAAVQDALRCWLSTESLQRQPMSTRRKLAARIVTELDHTQNIDYGYEELSQTDRDQLAANIELLMEAWFYGQAESLATISDELSRKAFADDLILRMSEWKFMELLDHPETATAPAVSSMAQISEMVNRWIERAPQPHQQRLRALYTTVQKQIFAMLFQ